jgi:TonB family protein
MRRTHVIRLAVPAVAALLSATAHAEPPAAPAPTRAEALQQAEDLLTRSRFAEAEAAYQKAAALPGGPCGPCMLGVASVRASEGKWDEAGDMTQRSLPLLTNPDLLARAYNQIAMAAMRGTGGPESLKRSEDALRNAVDYGTHWGDIARVNLAQVLFLEERWAEAVDVAREALGRDATETNLIRSARIVLCQARSHLPDELEKEPGDPVKAEGSLRPVRIAGQAPQYTQEARLAKTEGVVIVEAVIDREGCFRQGKVLQGQPNGLSEATLDATRLWVFSPATLDGKPVAVTYTLSTTFKVAKEPQKP